MREGLSPTAPKREGLNMEAYANAQLLFDTIKSFRSIRDNHRLRKLAKVVGLNVPFPPDPSIHQLEHFINNLVGKSFGNFEANFMAAQEIQGLLNDFGLRITCPNAHCRKPATLHCTKATRGKNGKYVFVHSQAGRQTHHGGYVALPENITLVPAAARKKRSPTESSRAGRG